MCSRTGALRLLVRVLVVLCIAATARAQCAATRLVSADVAPADLFGSAVDLEGDLALVGAWLQDPAQPTNPHCNSGAAYLFRAGPGGWSEEVKLVPASGACRDYFGSAVGLAPGVAVIGAPGFDRGRDEVGAVYVFEDRAGTWIERARLVAPHGADGDGFGRAVATNGEWIAIGAPGADPGGTPGAGSLFLFRRAAQGWILASEHTATVPDPGQAFGGALAFGWAADGWRLAVGASGDAEQGLFAGAAYVLRLTGGVWSEEAKLVASDARWHDRFGESVAIDGTRCLVGAIGRDSAGQAERGAVYAFERGSGGWGEVVRIEAPDASAGARLGTAVVLAGERALVGAGFEASEGLLTGAVYLLASDPLGGWSFVSKLRPVGLAGGDFLGSALALEGTRALLGASGDDAGGPQAGVAHVLDLPLGDALPFCVCAPLSACGNFELVDGCNNSTGRGASLDACGSASVLADDLVLRAARLPVQRPALLVLGAPAAPVPFGDGVACVGAPLLRFAPRASDALGRASFGPGLAGASSGHPAALLAGATRVFQVLYRDPQGPCGGGWNLTRALILVLGR